MQLAAISVQHETLRELSFFSFATRRRIRAMRRRHLDVSLTERQDVRRDGRVHEGFGGKAEFMTLAMCGSTLMSAYSMMLLPCGTTSIASICSSFEQHPSSCPHVRSHPEISKYYHITDSRYTPPLYHHSAVCPRYLADGPATMRQATANGHT